MSQFETLLYEVRGHIGIVTLNRPQALNSIDDRMIAELYELWTSLRFNTDVRVIVLTAAGEKGFSGGLDLKAFLPKTGEFDVAGFYRYQAQLARVWLAMRQCPQPIICTVFGAAVGAGFSMTMACDLRVISPDTRFAASYINVGFGGSDMGASYFLPRLIGAGRAYEFLLTGDFMDAATADKLGMVSRVVERDQLMPTAMATAEIMRRKNPLGLRLTKEAINVNIDCGGLEQALIMEDRNQAMCFANIRYEGGGLDNS